ncbi:MAG: hypothetical protein AAGC60_27660 [Acidobacteriota bacterium]
MSAQLVIRDGEPHWWASQDIWVVPGDDPAGAPGAPIAGESAYLWARTRNDGDQAVTGARVDWYWSNPATGVLRSNSQLVGSGFVDLAPGEVKEVLCLVPWVPVLVNDGHECVVAEIHHAADPLPNPLPDAFQPPAFHQVAQRNLTVLEVAPKKMMALPVQLGAPQRIGGAVEVFLDLDGELDEETLAGLGLRGFQRAALDPGHVALSWRGGCRADGEIVGEHRLEAKMEPGVSRSVHLHVGALDLPRRTYVPVHIVSRGRDERLAGGITYVLTAAEEA